LGAKEIKKHIQTNIYKVSWKEQEKLTQTLCNQLKQLLWTTPVIIPDPTTHINKANLMALEHDTCLEVLDQLIPKSWWGTPKYTALLNEMGINLVLMTKRNSVQI
jgi:hypothetical protein